MLELVYGEIESRFDQADFRIMQSFENLLLKAANGEVLKPEQSLLAYLEHDIDTEKFGKTILERCNNKMCFLSFFKIVFHSSLHNYYKY